MTNTQNLSNKTSIPSYAQYEVENMKQEKEKTRTQQTNTEKLDRLIEAGSNPARSTISNASFAVSPLNSYPFQSNNREILVNPRMLEEFEEFMRVNMRLEARTALATRETIKLFNQKLKNILRCEDTKSSICKRVLMWKMVFEIETRFPLDDFASSH